MPEETSSHPVQPDLPHDRLLARAEQVETYCRRGMGVTQAAKLVAQQCNVKLRTIWRAKRYRDAFLKLPEYLRDAVRENVNSKKVTVGYVQRLAELDDEHQREVLQRWKQGDFPNRPVTIRRPDDKNAPVTVPEDDPSETEAGAEPIRKSYHVQAILAKCGEQMGFKIWLPKRDRSAVTQEWRPNRGTLIDVLPVHYDDTLLGTIERIDVLWLKQSSIVHAFEVEHTTAVYSGILRMADLLALLPNMNTKLHIVAPASRRDKVLAEITRPVFSLLDPVPLSEICTYISYDGVEELAQSPDLVYMKDAVLEKYAEYAEDQSD